MRITENEKRYQQGLPTLGWVDRLPKNKRELTTREEQVICTRYADGETVNAIALSVKIGSKRVKEILARYGVID